MWSGNLSTIDLDLNTIWNLGCEKAMFLLRNYEYTDDKFNVDEEYTMMNPCGCELADDKDEDNDEEESIKTRESNSTANVQLSDFEINESTDCEEIVLTNLNIEEEELEIDSNDFVEMIDSAPKASSNVIYDGLQMHKSRAINLAINVCPYRQDRDRVNRVKTPIDIITGFSDQNQLDADIRITDFMITVAKFKDSTIAA